MKDPWLVYVLTGLAGVGGFLFGYDTGVVSGAMSVIVEASKNQSKENGGLLYGLTDTQRNLWHEVIVASTVGSAAVFALLAGFPTEKLGRKWTILSASVVFFSGSIVMGVAPSKEVLLVGRIIVGIGIGLASMSVPVYISETAPANLRGPLTVSYNTMVVFGQFIATVVCGLFAETKEGWRYMLGIAAVPAAVQFIGFLFMPESPRWLMSKSKKPEAEAILRRLRKGDIDTELSEIQKDIDNSETLGFIDTLKRCWQDSPTRRALAIGCSLQLFQQLSGINTLMYYTATIVNMAGVGSASSAIWISVGITAFYFLSCSIGIVLVEKLGRRKLLLASLGGVILSLVLIAVGFQLADSHSPEATIDESSVCGVYSTCSGCVQDNRCGYCSTGTDAGSCYSNSSLCANSWYSDYCPTTKGYSWTIIVGLALYLISFAAGMAPLPWTINSEIYPLWARSMATSVATGVNWTFNLVISMTFLSLTTLLTRYGAFYLYCGLASLAWLLFYLILPETQGVSLEQMPRVFSGKIIVLNKSW